MERETKSKQDKDREGETRGKRGKCKREKKRKGGKVGGEEMTNGVIPQTTVKTLLSTNRISSVRERGGER